MDDSATGVPTILLDNESSEVPTGAPITYEDAFQARSSVVESFLDVVLERMNATVMDFSSVDIDSMGIIITGDDISPFDLYFEE
eukprot:scaffold669513_cov126-Attheya_sp.AAC.1